MKWVCTVQPGKYCVCSLILKSAKKCSCKPLYVVGRKQGICIRCLSHIRPYVRVRAVAKKRTSSK